MASNKKKRSGTNHKNRPEFKSNYKVLTINLPECVIDAIDSMLGILYASRSEAIRYYIMRSLQADLTLVNSMNGDFKPFTELNLFNENGENYFVDKKNKIWFVGKAHENVGRAIQNV